MISATVASATDASSARIAVATVAGIAVRSSVTGTAPLFARNRSYRSIHVTGTGNCPVKWTTLDV